MDKEYENGRQTVISDEEMVERIRTAKDGRFAYIAATAHPDNQASVRGFTGSGYKVYDTREMYGGVMRCILYKKL